MNYPQAMRLLLALIWFAALIKAYVFFTRHQYDQLFFLGCGFAWATWIVYAVFKNRNLPAPFAYNKGENQFARITYCILVSGIFFFFIFI